MSAPTPSVVCAALGLDWPDGTPALDGLDLAVPSGRTGLVGRNGSGKSTLLRLIAGELTPTRGTLTVTAGGVALLPQHLPLDVTRTVADLLGVAGRIRALHAIESGDVDPVHLTVLADDWEVEARAAQALARVDLPVGLARPVGTLSGGEAVLAGVAGLLLRRAAVTLMDEPTNNLDRRARGVLHDVVDAWPGVLVVVSHDRELLERVDQVVELHDNSARVFGGPYSSYEAILEAEQEVARRRVRDAEGEVARERRQFVEVQTTLARRLRTGARAEREKRVPKIIAQERKRQAQVSAGRYRGMMADRLEDARRTLADAEAAVRDDASIRVDLPGTAVPAGRTVLTVGELVIRGPERVALVGPNGSGKTTLLEAIAGLRPRPGVATPYVPTAYLPQRLDVLDDGATVLDNVRDRAPGATPQQVRAGLARFHLRGPEVARTAGTLSGGERFRVALAALLLAEPPPQLLLLDEPTNNLDLASVRQLTGALAGYRGAVIVASHDERFLADVGVGRRWEVVDLGLPRDVPGLDSLDPVCVSEPC